MVRGKGKVKHKHILIDGKAVYPSHLNQFFASISTDPDYSLDDVIDFSRHIDPPDPSPYTSNTNTEIHSYEIEPVLRKLKNTAPRCDNLPACCLKSALLNWLMLLLNF